MQIAKCKLQNAKKRFSAPKQSPLLTSTIDCSANKAQTRHCEEGSDEAIPGNQLSMPGIASLRSQ
jgi:hypothetical protein